MQQNSGYEKVSNVVGEEMDAAWKKIMQRLAAGELADTPRLSSIAEDELKEFFEQLGGAQLDVKFFSLNDKGTSKKYTATELNPTVGVMGGSITIGGTWDF
ncbi:hypothetical protein [Bacillus subtilis]|uniref:hypothetical protein n=1 Tax=Bacillus subtilis TaxID=1423 RepID=UPI000B4B7C7C|nr:hypothetical protein [Bacillus subtilis]ASB93411.1 hypothetical protein S101392_01938 [Bacillus subtilis subsp. subtilis]